MSAPKVFCSSSALPTRETCASATSFVTVSRTSTTLDCSRTSGTDRRKYCRAQQVRALPTVQEYVLIGSAYCLLLPELALLKDTQRQVCRHDPVGRIYDFA